MKIGIVTLPLHSNYGGYLQAWALQEQLRKMGHEPVTIDCTPGPISWFRLVLSWMKTLLLRLLGRKRVFANRKLPIVRSAVFDDFVGRNMTMTQTVHKYRNKIVDDYGFDAFVVGSDQVWRPRYSKYLFDCFFSFLRTKNVKKIAYAASFGTGEWEYSLFQTKICASLAKRFAAISVREGSGVTLCQDYLGVEAVEVLDPTLLLAKEDYEKLCANAPKIKEEFLLCYILDITKDKSLYIENLAQKNGLQVRVFSAGSDSTLSVEEWVAMFRDAKFVLTDSFHGTVFSIIFHKPFLSVVNMARGADRFASLLSKFGLEERSLSDLKCVRTLPNIDWFEVDKKLKNQQLRSIAFLSNALS